MLKYIYISRCHSILTLYELCFELPFFVFFFVAHLRSCRGPSFSCTGMVCLDNSWAFFSCFNFSAFLQASLRSCAAAVSGSVFTSVDFSAGRVYETAANRANTTKSSVMNCNCDIWRLSWVDCEVLGSSFINGMGQSTVLPI